MIFLLVQQMRIMPIEESYPKLRTLLTPEHLLSLRKKLDLRLKVGTPLNCLRSEYKQVEP
jgi:hypothetical protein